MNILHINHTSTSGGAAVAAMRLHRSLLAAGIGSKVLVGNLTVQDPTVFNIQRSFPWDNILQRITTPMGLNQINIVGTFRLTKSPLYDEADILHLHNLHTQYFNYLALPALTKRKPAILTLHDMWPITGHCMNSFECERWRSGCGQCPHLDTYPSVKRDATAVEWKLKRGAYHHSRLNIVAPTT